jgi:hypothetical protein
VDELFDQLFATFVVAAASTATLVTAATAAVTATATAIVAAAAATSATSAALLLRLLIGSRSLSGGSASLDFGALHFGIFVSHS